MRTLDYKNYSVKSKNKLDKVSISLIDDPPEVVIKSPNNAVDNNNTNSNIES